MSTPSPAAALRAPGESGRARWPERPAQPPQPPAEVPSFQLTNHFPLARYRLRSVVTRPFAFPDYAGSALRGAFGHALRKAACTTGLADCKACPRYRECAYAAIFETPPPQDGRRIFSQIPNPYIVEAPPPGPLRRAGGELFEFDLVLIGPALGHLGLIVRAWQRALADDFGHGGSLRLLSVETETGEPVWNAQDACIRPHQQAIGWSCAPRDLSAATLHFHTPLAMQRNGRAVDPAALVAADLLMALVRRTAAFVELHLEHRLDVDFAALKAAAAGIRGETDWQTRHWRRFSSRQQRDMPVGGLLGHWHLAGDLAPFWPFLQLGQWLHVGKKCSFGLGRYTL